MKLLSTRLTRPLLAVAAGALLLTPAAQAATSANGDIFLGVRATSGTGSNKTFVINLGQASQFENATTTLNLGSIGTDLSATYGASWNTRANVFWGIAGTIGSFSPIGSDPAKTVFGSRSIQAPWTRQNDASQGAATNKLRALATAFNNSSSVGVSATNAVVQLTTDTNNWASYQPGGVNAGPAPGYSFAFFNPTVEASFGVGVGGATLHFYRVKPATTGAEIDAPGDYLGRFLITNAGAVTYVPQVADIAVYAGDSTAAPAVTDGQVPAVDFGSVNTESLGTQTFTIENQGNANLSGFQITLDGTDAADFTVLTPATSPVAPGNTTSFTIQFAPTTAGAKNAMLHVATNIPGAEGSFDFPVSGTGTLASTIAFSSAIYNVDQGSTTVAVTVTRSGGTSAAGVTIHTADGTSSTVPPFSAALAGTDYTPLSGSDTMVEFGLNETTKTVNITLIPKTATNTPNKRFAVSLSDPTGSASLGSVSTASVRIIANSGKSPTLSITRPGAVIDSAAFPYQAKGIAGAALGIDRVQVVLNGGAPMVAELGAATTNTAVPWSLNIEPAQGFNSLLVTVFDLSGSSASVRRIFTFTRRYVVTVARAVPAAVSATPDVAGTVAMLATPSTAASALMPATANTNPKTSSVVPGTTVKLTATPKVDYVFSHWSGVPAGAIDQGNVISFTMPVGDPTVTATFIENPFKGPPGSGTAFFGLLHPDAGTSSSNATEGFLTGTLTATTGLFTGKVLIDGVSQAFSATFYGDGSSLFTVGVAKQRSLTFGGRTLMLAYAGDVITSMVTKGTDVSIGTSARVMYSSTNKVPAALLNSSTKGFYTIGFPSKAQTPAIPASTYPQGDGFGTLSVSDLGLVTFTGTLADGTLVTASSGLVPGNTCPLFAQLTTPGAAATVKGGSFGGVLGFDATQADSDVSGTDILWFRPTVTAVASPAAAAIATNLYTDGWPNGIKVNAVGALYATAITMQTTLGITDTGSANAMLMFTDGKLTSPITKQNLLIVGNSATKVPATDATYTLALYATTGGISGTFKPNWPRASTTLPGYKGILMQKGANKGGYGFFISNANNDLDPESGGVTLSKKP